MISESTYNWFFYLGIAFFIAHMLIYGIGIDMSYFGLLLIYIGWRKIQMYSWIYWILWGFIVIEAFATIYRLQVIVGEFFIGEKTTDEVEDNIDDTESEK